MNTLKHILVAATLTTAALVSVNAYAGGFVTDFLQFTGVISPGQAERIDDGYRRFRDAVPLYGRFEENVTRQVRQGVRDWAGPLGSAAGDVVLAPINAQLEYERRMARGQQMAGQFQPRPFPVGMSGPFPPPAPMMAPPVLPHPYPITMSFPPRPYPVMLPLVPRW